MSATSNRDPAPAQPSTRPAVPAPPEAPSYRLSDGAQVDPTPVPVVPASVQAEFRLAGIRGQLAEARTAAEALRAEVEALPDVLDDDRGDHRHIARLNLRHRWAEAEARLEGLTLSEHNETRDAAAVSDG